MKQTDWLVDRPFPSDAQNFPYALYGKLVRVIRESFGRHADILRSCPTVQHNLNESRHMMKPRKVLGSLFVEINVLCNYDIDVKKLKWIKRQLATRRDRIYTTFGKMRPVLYQ